MKKPSEREIIKLISDALSVRRKSLLWNDDVAVVNIGMNDVAFKCDMFVRKTDAPVQMKFWQMARKSITSCVSDFACKGIRPSAGLVSLGIPNDLGKKDIADLAHGFRKAEQEYGISIIGGDTNEADDLVIDCCMVGAAPKIVKRSGAQESDLIVTTGPFGYTPSGLKILLERGLKVDSKFKRMAIDAVLMPTARLELGIALADYASSAMDSSDGLAMTLHDMSERSDRKFIINEIPSTEQVQKFASMNNYDFRKLVFEGGEEYEIVATIPEKHLKKVKALGKRHGCQIFVIGYVARGKGVFLQHKGRTEKIRKRGYEHLQ